MKRIQLLFIAAIILISFVVSGCNSWMGKDDRGYPTKGKFNPFYSKYESSYNKIDDVFSKMEKNYDLVKQQKMTVYDFRASLESMRNTLKTEQVALDMISTTPNGINGQYSVGNLQFACDRGIFAIDMFLSIPTNPNVNKILAFEDELRKGIDAKNVSKKYTDSIKAEVK